MEEQGYSQIDMFKLELGQLLRKYKATIDVAIVDGADVCICDQSGLDVILGEYYDEQRYKLTDLEWYVEAGDLITNEGELI